ncbi:MAG: FlgD immunoglobulin-like domain containing protein [Bacteroidota bacterium]
MKILYNKVATYFCLIIIMMVIGIEASIAQEKIISNSILGKYVMGSGGVLYSSGQNYFHSATAGEVIVGGISSDNHFLTSGFWVLPFYDPNDVENKIDVAIPSKYQLHQNYPNPFNPSTTIEYDIPELSTVSIEIYNITGQRVRSLIRAKSESPGYKKVIWDGKNDNGIMVATGAYFYSVFVVKQNPNEKNKNSFLQTKKMLFVK